MYKIKCFLFIVITTVLILSSVCFADVSGDLTERRTETADGYRIDYINSNGEITFATDKGYASIVYTYYDGLLIAEHYYSEFGNPVSVTGYFGILYEYYNGNQITVTFVDENDTPTNNDSTYPYSIKRREFDADGHIIVERYYSNDNRPIRMWMGHYGVRYEEWDDNNRAVRITYIGVDDEPIVCTTGYTTVLRSFNEDGFLEYDYYLGLDGEPCLLDLGHAGIRYIRDDSGKEMGLIYLDGNGQIITNNRGYSIVRYEYDEYGHIYVRSFFDVDGNPITLNRGQHSEVSIYEGNKVVRIIYLDINGNEIFLLDRFLGDNPWINIVIALVFIIILCFIPYKLKWVMTLAYAFFCLYMTLVVRQPTWGRMNLSIMHSLREARHSIAARNDLINNIYLFIPLGAGLASVIKKKRFVFIYIVLGTVSIELIQLVTRLGTFEIDDIIWNTLGGVIGVGLYVIVDRVKKSLKQ